MSLNLPSLGKLKVYTAVTHDQTLLVIGVVGVSTRRELTHDKDK